MADNFKTCGEAWRYCEKYGLNNISGGHSFQVAEALLRAYKDGANITSAIHSNSEDQCIECGEPNGKHLPGCKMPKVDWGMQMLINSIEQFKKVK